MYALLSRRLVQKSRLKMGPVDLVFWVELNLFFTFFCMQVITMCSVMS